jgi:hypothetical protein
MCLLRTVDVERAIISNDVLMISSEDFEHLGDDTYLRVLASDKRGNEISKSYYYFIVNKLRSIGLLLDNAISFKAVFPFIISSEHISLNDSIMFITDDKKLIYYNSKDDTYGCGRCPVNSECLKGLKIIVKEVDIKVRNEYLDDAWLSVITEIKSELLSNIRYIRAKAEIGKIDIKERIKVRNNEWAKQNF